MVGVYSIEEVCDHAYIPFMTQSFKDGEGRITNQVMKLICSKCLDIVDFGENNHEKG